MERVKKLARDWAEGNTVPDDKTGRDEEYEVVISIQAQAFEAGYRKGVEDAAERVRERESYDYEISELPDEDAP